MLDTYSCVRILNVAGGFDVGYSWYIWNWWSWWAWVMKWLFHIPVLGVLGKLRKATISFVMSVLLSALPHWKAGLSVDGLLWNLVLECFSKICRENSYFINSLLANGRTLSQKLIAVNGRVPKHCPATLSCLKCSAFVITRLCNEAICDQRESWQRHSPDPKFRYAF